MFETTGKNKEKVIIAGLSVSSGKLSRTHFFRVVRDEEVLVDRVKAISMQRHKDRVNEVTKDKVSFCPFFFLSLSEDKKNRTVVP